MRNYLSIAVTTAFAVALSACDGAPTSPPDGLGLTPSFSNGGGPVFKVTGGGSVVRTDILGSPREIYGFNAQKDGSGAVKGQAEVHFPSDNLNMHIDVTCLSISGNNAWLSGPVTRTDLPDDFPVGTVFVWRVVDNGQGKAADPDRISNFFFNPTNFPPDQCNAQQNFATFPWTNGNVRIH